MGDSTTPAKRLAELLVQRTGPNLPVPTGLADETPPDVPAPLRFLFNARDAVEALPSVLAPIAGPMPVPVGGGKLALSNAGGDVASGQMREFSERQHDVGAPQAAA